MTAYTIIDAKGEIVSGIDVPDTEHLVANTPTGCTPLKNFPPDWNSYWNFQTRAWMSKGVQPQIYSVWNPTTKVWDDPRTLDDIKDMQRFAVKAARDAAIGGGLTWDGSIFDSDDTSQARITGAVVLAQLALSAGSAFSKNWVLADNTVRILSATDMVSVGVALGTFVSACIDKGDSLRAQINAATDAATVQAITWQS